MKRILFFFNFYSQNTLAILILLFLMTGSIFYFIDFLGVYNYNQYTLNVYQSLGIENSVYYIPATSIGELDAEKEYRELKEKNFAAVKTIISQVNVPFAFCENQDVNIIACDQDFIETFHVSEKGEWFSKDRPTDSKMFDIVASGYMFDGKNVGDVIDLYYYIDKDTVGSKIKARIIGIDSEPSYALAPGYSDDSVTTDVIFQQTHNTVYMTMENVKLFFSSYTEEEYFKRNAFPIIVFRDDATDESRQVVLDYLSSGGRYLTYQDIIEASSENIAVQLKRDLPLPLFMLIVSSFAMIAVSVLMTNRKLSDYKSYYLCGCSRKRSFLQAFLAIGLVGTISGALNIMYVLLFSQILNSLPYNEYTYKLMFFIIGSDTIFYITIYIITTIIISVFIPFLLIKNNSAVELYRRQA